MSTLWTPGGERPVPRAGSETTPQENLAASPRAGGRQNGPTEAETAETMRQLGEAQQQLLSAPAEDIVANHCYGLFELAAVYLSARPPALDKARLAIDALGALVDGLTNRLGSHESDMRDALTQIRLAFVQIQRGPGAGAGVKAGTAGPDEGASAPEPGGGLEGAVKEVGDAATGSAGEGELRQGNEAVGRDAADSATEDADGGDGGDGGRAGSRAS